MKYFALLIAILLGISLSGCGSGHSDGPFGATSQAAAESGSVIVSDVERPKTIAAIRELAKGFGLIEWRDSDLEKMLGESEHRPVYSAYFLRGNKIALYFSNDVGATTFTYQLFREPFAKEAFPKFSDGVSRILRIPGTNAHQSGGSKVPPNNSFKPKPLRGLA